MKIFIKSAFFFICLIIQSFPHSSKPAALYPIIDPPGVDVPRNLRSMEEVKGSFFLNLRGLSFLRASGSGQFSEKTFKEMMRHLPTSSRQLMVIDLRQESHGFINRDPISWWDGMHNYANLYKTRAEIECDEEWRLQLVAQAKQIMLKPNKTKKPIKILVYSAHTERAFVESMGATYVRLPVTDHNRPNNDIVDQFIELVKKLSPDQWVHFHCRAGKGRTTTFLILFDMMKNAHQVSFQDILERQASVGSTHLDKFAHHVGEMKRAAEERLAFIQLFYLYCKQVPDFQISWSVWLDQRQQSIYILKSTPK